MNATIPWTRFMDMHSGGGSKEKAEYIHIQAPESEAVIIFYNRFGHSPHRVTCARCGEDYSVGESPTLEQSSAYDRGCAWDNENKQYVEKQRCEVLPYQSIEQYQARPDVLIIPDGDIKPEERIGEVPQQGYCVKRLTNQKDRNEKQTGPLGHADPGTARTKHHQPERQELAGG